MVAVANTFEIPAAEIAANLDLNGFAQVRSVLSRETCEFICRLYDGPEGQFRSTINMSRYNFGRGQYRYFAYPLPEIVQSLREQFYPALSGIANIWGERLGLDRRWPDTLPELTAMCHDAGQARPTPLILKYGAGDYNCLHQDLYGEIHFPLQVVLFLSDPEKDYEGGEFVLTEQRPRMQSVPRVLRPSKGDAVIIPVRERPVNGVRGYYRTQTRHGVSELRSGTRFTLGLIFHDAA